MSPRRAAIALATYVAAILVALAVPVSQLHTVSIETTCCCPDPSHCKCPDHKPDKQSTPSMRACHKTQHANVAPTLPSFAAPAVAVAIAPPQAAPAFAPARRAPHATPVSDEPYGPS